MHHQSDFLGPGSCKSLRNWVPWWWPWTAAARRKSTATRRRPWSGWRRTTSNPRSLRWGPGPQGPGKLSKSEAMAIYGYINLKQHLYSWWLVAINFLFSQKDWVANSSSQLTNNSFIFFKGVFPNHQREKIWTFRIHSGPQIISGIFWCMFPKKNHPFFGMPQRKETTIWP